MLTQTAAGRTYDFSHQVGGQYVRDPISVAVGSDNMMYVVTRGNEQISGVGWNRTGRNTRINKFQIGTTPGDEVYVNVFSTYGDQEGNFIWPVGIALDSKENVFVTDEWMNRVSVFDSDGNFLRLWGTTGSGDGELDGPSGIVIDKDDVVHVVDTRNHRVQQFNVDGKFLGKWGKLGSGYGELNAPWGITIDHEGYVYIADHKNNRAQKFTRDGEPVATFGSFGSGTGQLTRPSDVAVDPNGDVYVSDWGNNRVQVYEPDGKSLTHFVGDAQELSKWQKEIMASTPDAAKARRLTPKLNISWLFDMPTGLAFDVANSRLFVCDFSRNRLQIYNKVNGYQSPVRNI